MSSSGIRYSIEAERAAERARVVEAQRRWRRLCARADEVSKRCRSAGMAGLGIDVSAQPTGSSASLLAACDELERRIVAVENDERTRQLNRDMSGVLSRLAAREATERATARPAAHAVAVPEPNIDRTGERVRRIIGSLLEPSAELEAVAAAALCADPVRARLLIDDLGSRVAAANATTRQRRADRVTLAELRAEAAILTSDPAVEAPTVEILLDRAEGALDAGTDPAQLFSRVREVFDAVLADRAAEQDRGFVLGVLEEAFGELGYAVAAVQMETAGTLVLQAPDSPLGVRATVVDGEIDVRTARSADAPDGPDDSSAAQAVCADLARLPDALRRRGVVADRVRQIPAGLAAPVVADLPKPTAKPSAGKRRKSLERGQQ